MTSRPLLTSLPTPVSWLTPARTPLKIQPVIKGENRYCGPAALSIIARIDTTEAATLLRKISGKKSICGVSNLLLVEALRQLGFRCNREPLLKDRPTLRWWAENKLGRFDDSTSLFLVSVSRHYAVYQEGNYCCGITRSVVPLCSSPYRLKRVRAAWRVEKIAHESQGILHPQGNGSLR